MALLSLHHVTLRFGAAPLLDGVDLHIERGDRAALVGRNGAGKTSLLRLLHGELAPDDGEVRRPRALRVGYLPQVVESTLSGRVDALVTAGLPAHAGPDTQHDGPVVATVLSQLGLEPDAEFATLSGGQKRRVLLARALVCEPDLLLLDEPTNHLDIDTICWLESFLLRHCRTLLFVTHDRALLQRLANRIIDLDRGTLAHWPCDYPTFLRRKADLLHEESVRRTAFDKKLAQEEIWIRQGVKERRTRNEGRVRALLRMREERRARRELEGTARLRVQHAERSGRKVIDAKAIGFSYEAGPKVVDGLSTRIMRGDKIGIIGPNGSGKTTLLKLFTGELAPGEGELVHGTKLAISYFDQHRAVLRDEATVAESVADGLEDLTIDGKRRHLFGYLQDFLFTPDRARAPVKLLSGVERNRLLLARLFLNPSNLLVLDEPTNDLDAETLELLEEQLMDYRGTVLLVSHDRAFLNNVVTSLLVMQGDGQVEEFVGGYDDWLNARKSRGRTERATAKSAGTPKKRKPKPFGFKQKRELDGLPKRIETLEAEQARLHESMAAPDYFKTAPDRIATDKQREAGLTAEIDALYERWAALEALRDEGRMTKPDVPTRPP